jgi:hypothetical protein
MSRLPNSTAVHDQAYRLLGDAADWLRSDTADRLSPARRAEWRKAMELIGKAKDALNRAAGGAQ